MPNIRFSELGAVERFENHRMIDVSGDGRGDKCSA